MATSKPDILIILLQKLMEEGNVMYKVSKCLLCAVGGDVGPPLSLVLDAAATLLCGADTWQEWSSKTFPLLPRSLLISTQQNLHGKALLFVSENNCQESSQQWLWLPEGESLLGQLTYPTGRSLGFPTFQRSKHDTGPSHGVHGKRHQGAFTEEKNI